jgi:hypothetical protein
VNLSPARLAVMVALVVAGIVVLVNGFGSSGSGTATAGSSASPSITLSPQPTPTVSSPTPTETPKPKVNGVTFMVFNGTSTTGLGAQVQQDLEAEGYEATEQAGNAPNTPVGTTIVYFRGGEDEAQNESNATKMADDFLDGAKVKVLGAEYESLVPPETQLVVVVGGDFAGATP